MTNERTIARNAYAFRLKTTQIVQMVNYVSIGLAYVNFIKIYLTNFRKEQWALNNSYNSVAILVTGIMEDNDVSKARAKLQMKSTSRSYFW